MEQNTNRMWWTIGAIILGGLLLFGAITIINTDTMPKLSSKTSSLLKKEDTPNINFAKGGNISAWSTSTSEIMSDVESMNLNSVSIPVKVNISDISNTDATIDDESMQYAENVAALMQTKKINAVIEPYPYIANGVQTEVDLNPTNKHEFMTNWGDAVKTIARTFAKYNNVNGLYIGSNFVHLEDQTTDFEALIGGVHAIFNGDIIYRTNWWYNATWDESSTEAFEQKKETPLFKKVDVLSIASYFEVTNDQDIMSVPELKSALNSTLKYSRGQRIIDQIKELHEATGKPITFGELGISNYEGAMSQPYKYDYEATSPINDDIQSIWYTAWIETMKQYDWFKGYYLYSIGDSSSIFTPNAKAQETIRNMK